MLISDPSWENHRALFEGAGFAVENYPYYDAATRGVDFDGMLAALNAAPAGTIVVLHACCHNPTGDDLTRRPVGPGDRTPSRPRGLVPFLDMAYQGFGDGIAEDGAVVAPVRRRRPRLLRLDLVLEELLAVRRARRRAQRRAAPARKRPTRVLIQLKRVIRTNYSNPPTHGGQVVATVLTTPELRALWEEELAGMRVRIKQMRDALRRQAQGRRRQAAT